MNERRPEHQYIDTPPVKQGSRPEQTTERFGRHPEFPHLVESFGVVLKLSEEVRARGGQAFLVGGAVRDELLDLIPKDFDLEVHGLSSAEAESLLRPYRAEKPAGKSFGIYTLPSSVSKMKVEVALPRRDSQKSPVHNHLVVDVLPHLGLTEAARRREFTIGAIYKDVLSGEMYDPFNGIDDLGTKTLRMVDQKTFGDDALRVLRGAAAAARFGLTIEPETKKIMRAMVENVGVLSKERLREEWSKILVEGKKPSLGIELLRDVGELERWHPELAKLWTTPQNPDYHPEGDVGTHTMMVIDTAAELARQENMGLDERKELMFAALLHDIGKAATTENVDGRVLAHGHEAAGAKPTELFLKSIGLPEASIQRIVNLVINHMRPPQLYRDREKVTDRALKKLAREGGPSPLPNLVTLSEADPRGRGPFTMADGTTEFPDTTKYHAWWREQIDGRKLAQPPELILWGRDLVETDCAWPAGPMVGEAVRLGQDLAMQGMTREEVLTIIDASENPEAAIVALRDRVTTEST